MKLFIVIALLFSLATPLVAQSTDCDGTRYQTNDLFDSVAVDSDILYGNNLNVNLLGAAIPQDLFLDVYTPFGDTLGLRPVLFFAYGGSFIGGSRNDVVDQARYFAGLGYVVVVMDYRTAFFAPNEQTTTLAVMRAAHDMKASIRYIYKTVADSGNPYGIDTSRVLVGGISAGAITALHVAYLDKESELLALLSQSAIDSVGGIEGNSGSPGYSSTVHGVISYSGAIGDSGWIEPTNVPAISFHDTGDAIVPFDTREVSVSGIPTGLVASGSRDVHARLDNIGVPNTLYVRNASDHVGAILDDTELPTTYIRTRDFIYAEVTCKGAAPTARLEPLETGLLTLAPNPAQASVRLLNLPPAPVYEISVLNALGQRVLQLSTQEATPRLELTQLPQGTYHVVVQAGTARFHAQLIH